MNSRELNLYAFALFLAWLFAIAVAMGIFEDIKLKSFLDAGFEQQWDAGAGKVIWKKADPEDSEQPIVESLDPIE